MADRDHLTTEKDRLDLFQLVEAGHVLRLVGSMIDEATGRG